MYDLLIVGAGITAATLCAALKSELRVLVVDVRVHLGGNCHDHRSCGSFVHRYGPHIFHSTSAEVVRFLGKYTTWIPHDYSVDAEIVLDDVTRRVPFPYSRLTEKSLDRVLTADEVIKTFFVGYSKKMWGMSWDDLPPSIKGRVPKDTSELPAYFGKQFVALPKWGYGHMLENMFDGVELMLGVGPDDWMGIPARQVIYTGRPDLIRCPDDSVTFADAHQLALPFRSLRITFDAGVWDSQAACVNYCSASTPQTRRTSYARLTGGHSSLISTERPYAAPPDELNPYYPIPLAENIDRHRRLTSLIRLSMPNITFAGRMGTYKYLDMYQAVGQALAIARRFTAEVPVFTAVSA